jgi:hypothetical protein
MAARRAFHAAMFLVLGAASLPAQVAPVRGYVYYEDAPQTRDGLVTTVRLAPQQLEYVRLRAREAPGGFVLLARRDEEHWMGLESRGGLQLLRIRDASNTYNGRLAVDMTSGALRVLRGVDYEPFNPAEDAAIVAYAANAYLRRVMAGGDVFAATAPLAPSDLAALGLDTMPAATPPTAPSAAPEPMAMTAMPADASMMEAVSVPEGYLRLWSTAAVAARELFAANKFGSDSLLDSGDFAQATLSYGDSEGRHVLKGDDLEIRLLGRGRAPENPLRMDELETTLAQIASASGGLELTVDTVRTVFFVPSRPPEPLASGAPAGSRSPALAAFEFLQALSLLSGDYTVMPQGADMGLGLTQADIELYGWARMQRAGTPTALYPPRIDSGGKLPWGEFALFATLRLRRAGVPSTIVVIRRPTMASVSYHAVCLYQVGASWRWMDSARFGSENAPDWRMLPARIYGRDVVYRVVDVAREWLQPGLDEGAGWLTSRMTSQ